MASESFDDILKRLVSTNDNDRLVAARELAARATSAPEVDAAVREALAREEVPWVRGVLAEIVATSDGVDWTAGVEVPAPRWDAALAELETEVARELIHKSTRRVLHEVAAVVGRTKLAAASDLGGAYLGSDTNRELEFLSDVCAGLRSLSAGTQAPQPMEFDLAEDLAQLGKTIADDRLCPIHCNGPGPFIVNSDRRLIRLATQNIVVNAIEATLSVGPADEDRAVVLTWGVAANGFHVTVIDRGPGPPRFLGAIREAGVSTKEGHPGYGLATASEALRSVDGTVTIRRNDRGGATVVLAWSDLR